MRKHSVPSGCVVQRGALQSHCLQHWDLYIVDRKKINYQHSQNQNPNEGSIVPCILDLLQYTLHLKHIGQHSHKPGNKWNRPDRVLSLQIKNENKIQVTSNVNIKQLDLDLGSFINSISSHWAQRYIKLIFPLLTIYQQQLGKQKVQ